MHHEWGRPGTLCFIISPGVYNKAPGAVEAAELGASELIIIFLNNGQQCCYPFASLPDMELMWLYSLCQCTLSMAIVVASVRLCMAMSRGSRVGHVPDRSQAADTRPSSVSCCLRLCLGWIGAIGGAAGVPLTILLNLRTAQCLYTCITLVCCPLLVRHFTMFLLMLLTVDSHLQQQLGVRYAQKEGGVPPALQNSHMFSRIHGS